ncbi:MAG: hypothetical protein PSV35_06065, partial [bacterium]|nr:hypothetical protein [bacterium]
MLSAQDWTKLPSLSPHDLLLSIYLEGDFKLAYSREHDLYGIKLAHGTENHFEVELIVQSQHHFPQLSRAEMAPFEQYQDYFKNIHFSHKKGRLALTANSGYSLDEIRPKIKDQLLFDPNYSELQTLLNSSLPPPTITLLYLCIVNMRQFKKERLTGDTNSATGLLNSLLKEQTGACRHRAYLFKALFDCYKIPCRLITNDCHAFVEIKLDSKSSQWLSIDLGGYPAVVKNQATYGTKSATKQKMQQSTPDQPTYADGDTEYVPPQVSSSTISDSIDDDAQAQDIQTSLLDYMTLAHFDIDPASSQASTMSDSGTSSAVNTNKKHPIPIKATSYDFSKNPFALWAKPIIKINDFSGFWQNLNQEIQLLPQGTQNILLTFKNPQNLQHFAEALLKEQATKKAPSFYLNSPDEIHFNAVQIREGKYLLEKSELVNYLEHTNSQKNSLFIVKWSSKAQYIAYNTLIDTQQRRLGSSLIPNNMIVILLIEEQEANNLREDFYSRIRIKKAIPQEMNYGPNLILSSDKLTDSILSANHDLMAAEDWKSQILGSIEMQGSHFIATPGALITAIEKRCSGLNLLHAGPYLDELERMLKEISIKRQFYFNGITYSIPPTFTLHISKNAAYIWPNNYQIATQNALNTNRCDYVLNSENFALFFKSYTYVGQNGTQQLSAQNGFISPETAGKTLNVLVTGDLEEGEWAKLINHAKICNTILQLVIHQSNLPESMTANMQIDEPRDNEKEDGGSEAAIVSPSSSSAESLDLTQLPQVSYQVHNEIDFLADHWENKDSLIIHINQEMGYELIEAVTLKNSDPAQGISLQYNRGVLSEALLAGKTVILKIYSGMLSSALEANLQSLFLHKPYLWLNGAKVPFSGKLVIISNNKEYFSLCQHKTIRQADTKAQLMSLKNQFSEEKINELLLLTENIELTLSYTQIKTLLKR